MLVTTKQIVKKLPTNLRLIGILEEAITNSIQANATKIDIYFDTIEHNLLQNERKVKNVTIIDDGDGFTDKSIDSFNHYLSDYKHALGCKGIGRFTYLTICERVEFKSFNNSTNITFNFTIDTEEITPRRIENESIDKRTIVRFCNISDRKVSSDLQTEIKEITNHFLSIFKFMVDEDKNIHINLYIDAKFVDEIEAKENGSNFVDEVFSIKMKNGKEEKFTLSYKQKGFYIKGFYCADRRSVKQDDLGIKLKTQKDKGLLFFVTAPFFDKAVNDARNEFDIKDKNNGLFESLDWDTINRKLFSSINTVCKKLDINIEEISNKNKRDSLKAAPYLAPYIQKSQNMSTSAEIIKEAKELFSRDKDYIRNIKNKRNNDYETRLFVSNQAELAEYIFDREKIILDIKSDIEDKNLKTNETIIHNKIMKKKSSNDNYASYKDNNLWLFDERFMIYNYAYSDSTVNEILGLQDRDKNIRPDICIFAKSKQDIKDIVIIELKGSDSNGEKNAAGLNELNKYTRKIKDYFENNGEKIRIWAYLITTFNDQTRQEIEDFPGMKEAYTIKGKMYYLYNDKLDSITHILTLETMVEDAMSRNKLFLDILRGQYDEE